LKRAEEAFDRVAVGAREPAKALIDGLLNAVSDVSFICGNLDSHSIEALSHVAGNHIAPDNTPEWNARFPRRLPPRISVIHIALAQNWIEFCAGCSFLVPHRAGAEPTPIFRAMLESPAARTHAPLGLDKP
jgi:hypothetical protein